MCTFVSGSKIQLLAQMFTLNCKGKILQITGPIVMGIVNVTPDSFYKSFFEQQDVLDTVAGMLSDGATIIDIGGQSTRPGSLRVNSAEEAGRVVTIVEKITRLFPEAIISIDTYYSDVATLAVEAGASIINDVSGGTMDAQMLDTVALLNVPFVCMHMKGTPETMHLAPAYADVVKEVLDYFITRVTACRAAGIKDIIVDPGFGFGKNMVHNYQLLKHFNSFKMLDLPLLAGISRKGMVYKTLQTDAANALNGTTVLNVLALQGGADILRVHDVKEAVQAIKLLDMINNAK